jgi:hypothetical protein
MCFTAWFCSSVEDDKAYTEHFRGRTTWKIGARLVAVEGKWDVIIPDAEFLACFGSQKRFSNDAINAPVAALFDLDLQRKRPDLALQGLRLLRRNL